MVSQIKKGALISYSAVAFNAVAGLLYTPWMISSIGADDYGLYTLALSVVNFFLMDFGLSSAVNRFMSKYYAEGKEEVIPRFLGITYKAYLAIAAILSLVLWFIYFNIDSIYANLGSNQLATFKTLFFVVSLYSVISFPFIPLKGIFVSNEKFVAINLCELLQKVINVALIIVALLIGLGVFALVAVNALTGLGFAVAKYLLSRRLTNARADLRSWDSALAKNMLGFSGWVTVSQICQRLIFSIMPSIIAITSSSWEVTLFGLAASLEGYVWTVANALNGMFMPRVSRVLVDSKQGELQSLFVRFGRLQLYVVGFIFVCFICSGKLFVVNWMGPDFVKLWPCFLMLILPGLIELPQQIGATAITAANEVKSCAFVYIGMSVLNVLLGFPLAAVFGALGGCISICIAYFARTAGMNILYSKKIHLNVGVFFASVYPKWLLVSAPIAIIGFFMTQYFAFSGWVGFFLLSAAVFLIYAACLWIVCFDEYEKQLVIGLLHKIHKRK